MRIFWFLSTLILLGLGLYFSVLSVKKDINREQLYQSLIATKQIDSSRSFAEQIANLGLEQRYDLANQRIYDYDPDIVAACLRGIESVKKSPEGSQIHFQDEFIFSACVDSLSKPESGFLRAGFKFDFLAEYAKRILADDSLSNFHAKVLKQLCIDRTEDDRHGKELRFELVKKTSKIQPIEVGDTFDISAEEEEYLQLFCEEISVKFLRNTVYDKNGLLENFSDDKKICAFLVARNKLKNSPGLSSRTFVWILSEGFKGRKNSTRLQRLQYFLDNPEGEYRKILEGKS